MTDGEASHDMIEALSQVCKGPYQMVKEETALVFGTGLEPVEQSSDEDPPQWDRRDEGWAIDGFLGQYEAQTRQITIFDKGISHAAEQLNVNPDQLRYIVRIHEWGHGIFHVGVDEATNVALAKETLKDNHAYRNDLLRMLTGRYGSVEPYVHEQIAQLITWLALEKLRRDARAEAAIAAHDRLKGLFSRLLK